MTNDSLIAQVTALMDTGTEEELRAFVVEHLEEFPEEIRAELTMFFFEEALSEHTEGIQVQSAFIQNSVDALNELHDLKKILQERLALDSVHDRLKKHTEG